MSIILIQRQVKVSVIDENKDTDVFQVSLGKVVLYSAEEEPSETELEDLVAAAEKRSLHGSALSEGG